MIHVHVYHNNILMRSEVSLLMKTQVMIFGIIFLYLSILASAVRPAIVIPMCVSMGIIFFWWADNSEEARFSAMSTACVLLFSPTVAEPNFTASIAYSTWWSRPWGLHTVTSLSYWLRNWKLNMSHALSNL